MDFAMVPAAPPTEKNERATSWPPPISANVPYAGASKFSASAFCRVVTESLFMTVLSFGRSVTGTQVKGVV